MPPQSPEKVKKLTLTPFTPEQLKTDWITQDFTEAGQQFGVIYPEGSKRMSSGNSYKFILKSPDGNLFWFFLGEATADGREEARTAYTSLLKYCEANKIGKPYAYKVKFNE